MLDRELSNYELKQIIRVTKDAMRKNHYRHMHSKPAEPTPSSKLQIQKQ